MATSEFNQTNPWLEIWKNPRKMMAERLRKDPHSWVLPLAIINGLVSGVSWVISLWTKYPQAGEYKNGFVIALIIILGAVLGVISLYLISWLYKVTGKWLKGKGNFTDVKCAVGWSYYPYIVAALFGILNTLTVRIPFLGLLFGLISVVLMVWAFVISLKLLGEAHGFSAWRALATVFITIVLIFIVVLIIALIIPLMSPLFAS